MMLFCSVVRQNNHPGCVAYVTRYIFHIYPVSVARHIMTSVYPVIFHVLFQSCFPHITGDQLPSRCLVGPRYPAIASNLGLFRHIPRCPLLLAVVSAGSRRSATSIDCDRVWGRAWVQRPLCERATPTYGSIVSWKCHCVKSKSSWYVRFSQPRWLCQPPPVGTQGPGRMGKMAPFLHASKK